jgi:hypothetical protein
MQTIGDRRRFPGKARHRDFCVNTCKQEVWGVFGVEKLGRVGSLILRSVGALLLVTAGLKGYQAVTEPMAGSDIWTSRNFLILMVEFELAMGIWLVSGLFKKLAWLAGVFAFVGFSGVTLYKGLTGAESCGCFGSVHVNSWITLGTIGIPRGRTLHWPPSLEIGND